MPYVADDRFKEFSLKRGEQIGSFVYGGSIGKALCESDTWLNNEDINRRFISLLKRPFGDAWEPLFPNQGQNPVAFRAPAATLSVLWQIRHGLAHNVGIITQADSMKFRAIIHAPVAANRRLTPTLEDLGFVKRFLLETAQTTNDRVATRLAEILGLLYGADPGVFVAGDKANEVSQLLNVPIAIANQLGTLQIP